MELHHSDTANHLTHTIGKRPLHKGRGMLKDKLDRLWSREE